ncbi:MAG TPA: FAD-dependent oxidoreductase [Solirubrobacteraceae bacterium]|nr:FAD-dependent oxidoreductase [Solirubrobacteraceae bacterium]
MSGVVIVGGGLAGQRCAETLRRCGYEGSIVMVCGEPHLPYDRPPLSKELLPSGREARLPLRILSASLQGTRTRSTETACTKPTPRLE